MKVLLTVAIIAFALWLGAALLLYLLQDRLTYHAMPAVDRPGAPFVLIPSGPVSVKVWVLHDSRKPALIYFGGNAEDVGASRPEFDALFPEHAVYLVTYRGFGGAAGRPSEDALGRDALAVYDWVARQHPKIVLMGRSLGTGVATTLAASRPIDRLILVTPFDSLTNVASDLMPLFPVRWLLRDRYESVARIGQVQAPILALVAERDPVISRRRSDSLIAAIPEARRHSVLIRGATHDDIHLFPAYRESIQRFLAL